MIKKLVTTATIAALLFMTNGCAQYQKYVSPQTQTAIVGVAAQLSQRVLAIAQDTVDSFAQGKTDAEIKNQFMQSAGDFLRSLEGTGITIGQSELAAQLKTWLPDKSHWQDFASDIGSLISDYVANHGNSPGVMNAALEAVAMTLNTKSPEKT